MRLVVWIVAGLLLAPGFASARHDRDTNAFLVEPVIIPTSGTVECR